MTQPASSRREMLRASGATFAAALAHMTWPEFTLAGQDESEELVPFINEPRTPENRLTLLSNAASVTLPPREPAPVLDVSSVRSNVPPSDETVDVPKLIGPPVSPAVLSCSVSIVTSVAIRIRPLPGRTVKAPALSVIPSRLMVPRVSVI